MRRATLTRRSRCNSAARPKRSRAAWDSCEEPRKRAKALFIDLGFDQLRQISQRLLPAEITSLRGNDIRHPGLRNIQFGADRHFLDDDGHLHLAWQVGI